MPPALEQTQSPPPTPLLSSAALLVDVDNYDELREALDESVFGSRLMSITRDFLSACTQEVDQLTIRLYGGWFEGSAMTARASEIAKYAQMSDPFPLITSTKRIAGHVELATGPVCIPGMIMPHTFRRRATAPRIRRARDLDDPTCRGDSECSAKRLSNWSEGPKKTCPSSGCTVTYEKAFFGSEQKMIDALIAMDLIEMVTRGKMTSVAVVSDDTDFIPALVYAAHIGDRQVLSLRRRRLDPLLAQLLANAGVNDVKVA